MNGTTALRAQGALVTMALVLIAAAPAAMAQPAPPAGNPRCGSVAGLMHHLLAGATSGAIGRNFVSIPRVSPINATPGNQYDNGFHRLCGRMGLSAPPSGLESDMPDVDGDSVPDNATLFQYDGMHGQVNAYNCNQILTSSEWDEGTGVEIRPVLSSASSISLIVPGVECSQPFAVYEAGLGRGVNYLPIPLSTTCSDRGCLCDQLNLPDGTKIQTIDAAVGNVEDYICTTPRSPDPYTRGNLQAIIPSGEAARIEPPGNVAAPGEPVNCLSGIPCPATPSEDYPAPLIY